MARSATKVAKPVLPPLWWRPWTMALGCLAGLLCLQRPALAQEKVPATPKDAPATKRELPLPADSTNAKRMAGLEVGSMVVDQTISKIGHDFYDVFYAQWEAPADANDFMIVIREKPSRGLGAMISVQINDADIMEMPIQPKFDQIEASAFSAVAVAQEFLVNQLLTQSQLDEHADQVGNGIY